MIRNSMGLALIGICGALPPSPAPAADPPRATTSAPAPASAPAPDRPEVALLKLLSANPATAPYRFTTTMRGGKIVLSGRVATKQIHDIAVRTAIAGGFRIDDSLVIDTAEVFRTAVAVAPMPGPVGNLGLNAAQMTGTLPYPPPTYGPSAAGPPFLYPPPLFGRYDDPFWGFEPPVVTYPGWWGPMSARRLASDAPTPLRQPTAQAMPADGSIAVDIDPLGVAKLTGTVPTEEERIAVAERVAQSAGVTDIINNLAVAPAKGVTRAVDDPPPPPVPAGEAEVIAPQPIVVDAGDPSQRLVQALSRRPDLVGLPIRATVREGRATIAGKVPTAFEAMLAFRAAQQLPGINSVEDRLEFTLPDGQHQNPLLKKGRPEDVEPYLEAQIRRQVGDRAHVDRVRLLGDTLDVRGTVADEANVPRVEATLRSMPLLRGFDLKMSFLAE